jgi:NADPH:quinone reductase-like Zn-dependent oxidoreductase
MKAVRIHGYGDVSTLSYEDAPLPEPGADDVRIRVHAAAVNPVDWKIRAGYLASLIPFQMPLTLGWDVSGVVDKVGTDVSDISVGDAVYSRPDIARDGTYAEYAVVRASEVAAKPKSLSHNEAAAVPLAALTAWQCLMDAGELKSGQRVLIHAGAGGVGSFAIQFAKAIGAEVVATASEPNKALVLGLGADQFVDYRSQRFEDVVAKVDVVLDTIGGDTQARSMQVLKTGGRLVSVVQPPDEEKLATVGARGGFVMVQPNSAQLKTIGALIDDKKVRVLIDSVFPLSQVKDAHTRSETGRAKGKIVLEVIAAGADAAQ